MNTWDSHGAEPTGEIAGKVPAVYAVTALAALIVPPAMAALCWLKGGVLSLVLVVGGSIVWIPCYLVVLYIAYRLVEARVDRPRYFHRASFGPRFVTIAGLWAMILSTVMSGLFLDDGRSDSGESPSTMDRLDAAIPDDVLTGLGCAVPIGFLVAVIGYVCASVSGRRPVSLPGDAHMTGTVRRSL